MRRVHLMCGEYFSAQSAFDVWRTFQCVICTERAIRDPQLFTIHYYLFTMKFSLCRSMLDWWLVGMVDCVPR